MRQVKVITLFNIVMAFYHGIAYILTDSLLYLGGFVLMVTVAVFTDNADAIHSMNAKRDYTGRNDTGWIVKGEDTE